MISNGLLYSFFTMWNSQRHQLQFLEKSTIHLIKLCIWCKLAFPKDTPVAPDGELVFMRKERCERPVKFSAGKFMSMAVTNHLGRNIYCVNKNFYADIHIFGGVCLWLKMPQSIVFLRLINCFLTLPVPIPDEEKNIS